MADHCLSCGRDTAPETPRFAARKRAVARETGAKGYLCEACLPGSGRVMPDQSVPLSGRYVVIEFGWMGHG